MEGGGEGRGEEKGEEGEGRRRGEGEGGGRRRRGEEERGGGRRRGKEGTSIQKQYLTNSPIIKKLLSRVVAMERTPCHIHVPERIHVNARPAFILVLTVRSKPHLLHQRDTMETGTGIHKRPAESEHRQFCLMG